VSALALATPSDASGGGQKIEMEDSCQPASVNAFLPPGTCVRDGETSFGAFIAELTATQRAKDWGSTRRC